MLCEHRIINITYLLADKASQKKGALAAWKVPALVPSPAVSTARLSFDSSRVRPALVLQLLHQASSAPAENGTLVGT